MLWFFACFVVFGATLYLIRPSKQREGLILPHLHLVKKNPPIFLPLFVKAMNIGALFFLGLSVLHTTVGSGPFTSALIKLFPGIHPPPKEGTALFFVVDRSGSMGEVCPSLLTTKKYLLADEWMNRFISTLDNSEQPQDFLGLITFARAARTDAPLSLDRSFLKKKIDEITPETLDKFNGTALGYAVFKTVSLIIACQSFSQGKDATKSLIGQSMVVITDGFEEPNPSDRENPFRSMRLYQALSFASENKVRVHYINIDKNTLKEMSFEEKNKIRSLVEATGGTYTEMIEPGILDQALTRIVDLEKTKRISEGPFYERATVSFWLLTIAFVLVGIARILETLILRVIR